MLTRPQNGWVRGVTWVSPGRALLAPEVRKREIPSIVAEATTIQFQTPLPTGTMQVLAAAMRERPEVGLYLYAYGGWGPLDGSLSFLAGFEHLRSLSLALEELPGFEGLERFTELRELSLRLRSGRRVSLAPLAALNRLTRLSLELHGTDMDALARLPSLRRLWMSAAKGTIEPLADHPGLERLQLHYGTERELSPLTTCTGLRDLSIWCITRLDADDLRAVGEIPKLDALMLGALRNVESLEPLASGGTALRFLELERLPSLKTLAPLARLRGLRACTIFDSVPADRSLEPLRDAPQLEEVAIGGDKRFPKPEVEALAAAFSSRRISYRNEINIGPDDVPRLRWRGLFSYVDAVRSDDS